MKKLSFIVSLGLAALSLSAAYAGANMASYGGWYQPKVPNRISK